MGLNSTAVKSIVFLLVLLLIISCAKSSSNQIKTATKPKLPLSNVIANGTRVNNIPKWIAALYVNESSNMPLCTGEFISDIYIITAAHCIAAGIKYVAHLDKDGKPTTNTKFLIENSTQYKSIDVALIKLYKPYPNITPINLYHGYYFNQYLKQSKKYLFFGYGALGRNKPNITGELNSTEVLEAFTFNNHSIMLVQTIKGYALGGDSGGGIVTSDNNGKHQSLIGVLSHASDPLPDGTNYIYFSVIKADILKWIALNANMMLFSYPSDNQIYLVKNHSLRISGWGQYNHSSLILIKDGSDTLATCRPSDISYSDDSWQCVAHFESSYMFNSSINYGAVIINTTTKRVEDSVSFKLTTLGTSLIVLHPKSNSNFTYHTPLGSTYLISGVGTSGAKLSYVLYNITNPNKGIIESLSPCVNSDAEVIADNGIWQCRVKVAYLTKSKYNMYISYEDANIGAGININTLVTTGSYNLNPQTTLPNLTITYPKAKSILYPKHFVRTYVANYPNKTAQEVVAYANGYPSLQYYIAPTPDNLKVPFHISTDLYLLSSNELNDANITLKTYIDNDIEPLNTTSLAYFLVIPYINITSIKESMHIDLESDIDISGSIYYMNQGVKQPLESGLIYLSVKGPSGTLLKYNCNAIRANTKGVWRCPEFLKIKQVGDYEITAKLSDEVKLVESSNKINISSKHQLPVDFETPPKYIKQSLGA